MNRSGARRTASVGMVLVLLGTLGACVPAVPAAISAPGGEQVSGDLAPFFDQSIDWTECGANTECGSLRAPLNWADASMGDIHLAVARYLAPADTRQGSLLVNPGGPGASGYDFVVEAATFVTSPQLRANFDIVGWDPRGVGRSSAVVCLDDAAKDKLLYGTGKTGHGTDAWFAELAAAEAAFVAACAKNTGELLGHVDSQSTARDMNLLRAVLGDAKLNYLGFSYGSYFGAMFAELFPDKVGRLVLDGAIDPMLKAFDWFGPQMAGFDSAFRSYLVDCIDHSGCPFTGPIDAALAQFDALLTASTDRALLSSDGRVLDSATLGLAVSSALYSQRSWSALSAMLSDVIAGSADLAFSFVDSYDGRNPDGSYSNNSFEVYTATLCLDGDYRNDGVTVRDGLAEIASVAPILGVYLGFEDYAHIEVACSQWPYPSVESPTVFDAVGAAPILVVGTTNDPATPYAWAQSLASQLSSARLVTFHGEGHTAYSQGNPCVDDTVDAYFITGTVPASDPSC